MILMNDTGTSAVMTAAAAEGSGAPRPNEHRVKLEVFEGPLDLLLYLIKREEVDIHDIPIELIARQYMETLSLMKMLDLNIAGEFLVMAATLMMIKSRMLLPVEDRPEAEQEEEDPRWDLVKQLLEYKKFKEVAGHLHDLELRNENLFARGSEDPGVEPEAGVRLDDVGIFDLIAAFSDALKQVERNEPGEIHAERFTVAEKIEDIVLRLQTEGRIAFSNLFKDAVARAEIVCTFLALLELIRSRRARAIQERLFGEIMVVGMTES